MIKHIVMWKIHKDGTRQMRKETIDTFRSQAEFLKTVIPQLKDAVVSQNLLDGDVYHLCLEATFDSKEDLDIYINHPEHLKVRGFIGDAAYDKTTFDYEF